MARATLIAILALSAALVSACVFIKNKNPSNSRHARQPNILIAVADDWGYGHSSIEESGFVQTPAFDRVAREGVIFTNAYTPNAKCAPSRAILLTGRQSWLLEEAANHWAFFPAKFKTWIETLADAGYRTGMTGKGWAPGVANDESGAPRTMTGAPHNDATLTPQTSGISDIDYAENFRRFLNEFQTEETPWVFWYGSLEPHRSFEFGSGEKLAGKRPEMIGSVPPYWPDNETVRSDMLDYALEVEHFDRHLGMMLDELEARGELDDTIVIVTSDHGPAFPRMKGQSYPASNHVPLAIRWAGGVKAEGRAVDAFVNFADIAPTLFDLLGVDAASTGMAPISGVSFAELLISGDAGRRERDFVLVGKERHDVGRPNDAGYPMRGILRDGFLYIKNFEPDRWPSGNPETGYLNTDGSPTKTEILRARRNGSNKEYWSLVFGKRPAEEFYDLKSDPFALINLADDPDYAETKERLRGEMVERLRRQGDPRIVADSSVFDQYVYADETFRNFYERWAAGEDFNAWWVSPTDAEDLGGVE